MGVPTARLERLKEVLSGDGLLIASLFGSALGDDAPGDIDVAVLYRSYHFGRHLEMAEAVQAVLGPERADLVALNLAPPPVKLRALLEGRLLYAESAARYTRVVAETVWEYDDYRWFLGEYREQLARRCREGLSMTERRMDRERVETYLAALDDAVANLRRLGGRVGSSEAFTREVDTDRKSVV